MKKRYSCISIFPEESLSELKSLQDKIFSLTGSQWYRKQRPLHFTLWVGNDLTDEEFQNICIELKQIASHYHPFEISLGWIKFIEFTKFRKQYSEYEPYVIWIDIHITQTLQQFVDDIDRVLRRYEVSFEIMPYLPHVTIAARDLNKQWFELLQKELKNFSFTTTLVIDNFSLVLSPCKENNISSMQEAKRFLFEA